MNNGFVGREGMKYRITHRTVNRWFYRGKGYSSLHNVTRKIAQQDLNSEVYRIARRIARELDSFDEWRRPSAEAFARAWVERFPHHEVESPYCGATTHDPNRNHFFCAVCRREWIAKRAKEIRELIEATA